VVSAAASDREPSRAWQILEGVADPEIPVLSVVDLGIVRTVEESDDHRRVTATLTPTYSGCPATDVISHDVREALAAAYDEVEVKVELSPAWTTDWLSDAGRAKLLDYGIAPPHGRTTLPLLDTGSPEGCPQCGSADVAELAGFGSTPCKALWRCRSCHEPFDYFKVH
jgi:ring-1,2-phenylacetyl-CoA epoxidase subunit PaaD